MRRAAEPNDAWMRGRSLDFLKSITAIINAHDGDLVLGNFTRTSERTVADWDAATELKIAGNPPQAIMVIESAKSARKWVDFAGEIRASIAARAIVVKKIAGPLDVLREGVMPKQFYFEGWMEHDTDRTFAEMHGLVPLGVKVRASSELWGLFGPGDETTPYCLPADEPALRKLKDGLPVAAAARAISERPPAYADHYSTYNVKHTWSAVALRGYGGLPGFIIKPAEMAKKWKSENLEKLAWKISDTPARADYPELEPLINAVPGVKHRIRLMNLAPGGGELKRHADITDPDAGTRNGCLCRIHIPLQTNPDVRFTSWMLLGDKIERHMAAGEMWYLDTRKPHRAINGGSTARVHLVLDVESSPTLRAMLGETAAGRDLDLFGNPL